MRNYVRFIRKVLRKFGYDFHRFDPDLNINTFINVFLPALKVNCVLDVGARLGEYAILLRENNYKGHIFSFEPVRSNYKVLCEKARGDPYWHTFPFALGSENTTAKINI